MAKLTADQAFALAQSFHDLSVEIGNYRFRVHQDLTPAQRRRLEDPAVRPPERVYAVQRVVDFDHAG